MTDVAALQQENEELRQRLADAEQTLRALTTGEVDAVAAEVGGSPVLLRTAQERLRESERLLRAVFEGASDAMILSADSGVFLDVNGAACELFGRPRAELVGRVGAEHYTEYDAVAARERLRAEGALRDELKVRRPDGQLRAVEFTTKAGIVPGVNLSIFRDVTGRRQTEEMRSRLASIVESSVDAIIGLDPDGAITTWNQGAESLFQWHASEVLGKEATLLVPVDLRSSEHAFLREKALRGEPVALASTKRLRKDGSLVAVSLTVSPIRDPSGRILGVSKIVRDLTERLKAEDKLRSTEEQLRQAQKMEAIGVLAGGVAHDFNNLLSVILSYTALALDELKPGDPLRGDLEEVARAGQRATELTKQLLAFSRKQVLQPRVLDVGEVVRGLEKMLGRLLGEHIELSIVTPRGGSRVRADPSQLEQVVMNLAVNARDAMPGGGQLTIDVCNVQLDAAYAAEHLGVAPGRYVQLAITDTGVGMDAATRERIFEPFFTTKGAGKGTGLGLSTVFGIVKQSQGHVWVYSEPGRGTAFKVYLLRVDDEATWLTTPPPTPASLEGSETILLVEDEDQVRMASSAILRRHGYHVLDARGGGEALLVCEQFKAKIHLLVTDVVMPRMTGRQLAERLQPLRPDMKVLYLSGYTADSIVHHGVLDAGIAFLAKPVTPDGLLRKVREVLGG